MIKCADHICKSCLSLIKTLDTLVKQGEPWLRFGECSRYETALLDQWHESCWSGWVSQYSDDQHKKNQPILYEESLNYINFLSNCSLFYHHFKDLNYEFLTVSLTCLGVNSTHRYWDFNTGEWKLITWQRECRSAFFLFVIRTVVWMETWALCIIKCSTTEPHPQANSSYIHVVFLLSKSWFPIPVVSKA